TDLQIQFTEAVSAVADQKDLIAKLEHDLSTIQSLSTMHAQMLRWVLPFKTWRLSLSPLKKQRHFSMASHHQQASRFQKVSRFSALHHLYRGSFRPNHELEAENHLMQHTMQAAERAGQPAADNIKLYEKIKFLQSYPGRGSGSDDTELRYSSQYEERLDPFTSFSRKERQRKYQSLSPWDKATLSLVLYKIAWSESVGRDCSAYCMLITCTSSMRMETMGISGNEGGATHKWTKPVPHPRAALLSPSSFSFPYKNVDGSKKIE
ncbi:putative Protein CASP isoform b protein, partial [Naja naja]